MAERRPDLPTVIDAFRAGDESALAEIYQSWSPLVYSLALRALGDVAGAEAVTQRVFIQAWTARKTFDPIRTRLSAWLVDLAQTDIAGVQGSRSHSPHARSQGISLADKVNRLRHLMEVQTHAH